MVIMARVVDTSVAQLANFFIAYGAVTYLTEESFRMEVENHRTRSRTIKFLWSLQLPEHWLNLIQEALPEEENESTKRNPASFSSLDIQGLDTVGDPWLFYAARKKSALRAANWT